ncbi:hypothetical protein FRACYDRAFT_242453 [Fragilariopsis cylindrus CCMP1102]|uniref:Uncharacterized protein n=1 Tax=Fragilariopsis cylindrus CCMP1102 TaxID=635003 RepID=A0A1E7F7E7_9STRA|nr:hypothetical protein FRACYDRAFT_242453 [Fragilariopsis cylindrus CCMP1102]|eukprot:OEU14101.1 hypothetical protein FRACYDRAFT_242453 [Fragilariopsis cylindrus CCMP1102]
MRDIVDDICLCCIHLTSGNKNMPWDRGKGKEEEKTAASVATSTITTSLLGQNAQYWMSKKSLCSIIITLPALNGWIKHVVHSSYDCPDPIEQAAKKDVSNLQEELSPQTIMFLQ